MRLISGLPETASGTYLITTASGTRYLVRYDRRTFIRITPSGPVASSVLRRDGEEVDLVSISACAVGRPLLMFADLHLDGVAFTVRPTTPVVSFEHVDVDALTDPKRQ
jgi:hypothetical protein